MKRHAVGAIGAALTLLCACHTTEINDDRIPRAEVYVPFTTEGQWNLYTGGAVDRSMPPLTSRIFDRAGRIPADYPYPDYSFTGYGGLLLAGDVYSVPRCYDRSCPVERQRDKCVVIDPDTNLARCPWCGSTYDVFGVSSKPPGYPVSGPAATDGYRLRVYAVRFGVDGRFALLTR